MKLTKQVIRLLHDFAYTFLSIGISIFVLQLLVYPVLSRSFSADEYGKLIAIIGVISSIYQTLGSSLAQTRLLRNKDYINTTGDFQLILLVILGLVILSVVVYSFFFHVRDTINLILGVLFLISAILNTYTVIIFRINLDYKNYFYSNLLVGIGYVLGVLIFLFTKKNWYLIFILSQVLPIIFNNSKSKILFEPVTITRNYRSTVSTFCWLILSNGISNNIQYLDKIIIYPLLGGDTASMFFAASYFAKSLSLIVLPVSNVMLSYLASGEKMMEAKHYTRLVVLTVSVSLVFLGITNIFSNPVISILFPTLASGAQPFIMVSSMSVIVGMIATIAGLPLLVYAPTFWQLILNLIQFTLYLGLAVILSTKFGLLGFINALLLANTIRFMMVLVLNYWYLTRSVETSTTIY